MKRIAFVLLLVVLFAGGCKRQAAPEKKENINRYLDTITEKVVQQNVSSQREDYSTVVEIDSPAVVFFMPEYKERENIMRFYGDDAYSKLQLQQMFRNFYRLYRAVCIEVKKDSIGCFFTYHWRFNIKVDTGYVYFDRKEQNQLFGFFLANGHEQPQIYYGLYRIGEMERFIGGYFGLKDFKIKQRFTVDQSPPIEGSP